MRRTVLFFLLICGVHTAHGQTGGTCDYWFDSDYDAHQTFAMQGNSWSSEIDVSSLNDAVHTVHFQMTDGQGIQSPVVSHVFVKYPLPQEPTTHTTDGTCYYWFDTDYANAVHTNIGSSVFSLDVSNLSDGVHTIHIYAEGSASSPVVSHVFVVMPLREQPNDKITGYDYWLNEENTPTSVQLPEPVSPYNLVSLLPVATQPLRSSCFHFQLDDGQPVIYAKNDIRLRFYCSATNFTDITAQYVDYSVKEQVNDFTVLEPGTTVTDKPASNTIKWYKLEAEAGDLLQFKLDRAATIQLFAPSGQEVFAASGPLSVQEGGIYAEESGTFYLALHDVTAQQGTTVSLTFGHIDRYAVLSQDVTVVGNGGPSTITFQGNGFDELTSVDLMLGRTTISSITVNNNGKAMADVKFSFDDAPLGDYEAVFHFGNETVMRNHCISVVDAVPLSCSATVAYAPQFLVSKGNNYDFKVTNLGNMTYYDVPMTLSIYASNADVLTDVIASGCVLGTRTILDDNTDIEGYPYLINYVVRPSLRPSYTELLSFCVKTADNDQKVYVFLEAEGMQRVGGPSTSVASFDPNDIFGYQDADGGKTLPSGMLDLWYTIEFENDPAFATASAHDIYVTDVLDPALFDLSTFTPTRIQIGDQEVTLENEDRNRGVVTIDMRPQIYAVAQVEWTLNEETGVVQWHISSLDPMKMEPTTEVMDGVLPVNVDGNGIGQLSFDIRLKDNLSAGTEIPNMATIVFDENEAIDTPTWTNITHDALFGDLNNDYLVDVSDVTRLINIAVSGVYDAKYDLNNDQRVDVSDVTKLINIAVGNNNTK